MSPYDFVYLVKAHLLQHPEAVTVGLLMFLVFVLKFVVSGLAVNFAWWMWRKSGPAGMQTVRRRTLTTAGLVLLCVATIYAADAKISAMTESTAPVPGDWAVIETAGGASRKVDWKNIFNVDTVRAHLTATQTIADITVATVLYTTEDKDTNAMHSTSSNTSRFIAVTAGYYRMCGEISVPLINVLNSAQQMGFRLNGTTIIAVNDPIVSSAVGNSTGGVINLCTTYQLAANDYMEEYVYQNSGGNQSWGDATLYSWFEMQWTRP